MSKLFNPGYYNEYDLQNEGFKNIGVNVLIAKNCQIIGVKNIFIGNNVRIDGYSTLVTSDHGFINIGSNIHISSYCRLSGIYGIEFRDFSGLSQGVSVYSSTDDYSGEYLTNPTIPQKFRKSYNGSVLFEEHVIVGSGSVILPNIIIGEGASIGALTLVNKSLEGWNMYLGIPARKIGERSKGLLKLKEELLKTK